jgi:hypothetical protein
MSEIDTTKILRRLREPPFGTETSERNLMATAADIITDLTRRLAEVTAERDALQAYIVDAPPVPAEVWEARATRAEAALSRRDEALRVAREALATILDDNSEIRHPCDPPRPGHFGSIAKDALAKIDALTKPQEAGG